MNMFQLSHYITYINKVLCKELVVLKIKYMLLEQRVSISTYYLISTKREVVDFFEPCLPREGAIWAFVYHDLCNNQFAQCKTFNNYKCQGNKRKHIILNNKVYLGFLYVFFIFNHEISGYDLPMSSIHEAHLKKIFSEKDTIMCGIEIFLNYW